jgi:hypothetical protein
MSPTNLADLRSDQPAPTGLCQIKRGQVNGTIYYTNAVAQGTIIHDGNNNPMRIGITPARAGWWIVRAENIWSTPDAAWAYFTWYLQLSPADADGVSQDWNHGCIHSALSWQESSIHTAYRLNAGVAYTVTEYWGYSQGYNQGWWSGPDYCYIMGEFVEGRV